MAYISKRGRAIDVDSPHGPQIHPRLLPQATRVGIVDHMPTNGPQCPRFAVLYSGVYAYSTMHKGGLLVAVDSPHDPQNFEGGGGRAERMGHAKT